MTIDEWISGNDSVDAELNFKKINLLDRAMSLCVTQPPQEAFSKQHKARTYIKEISHGSREVTPIKNSFTSDPAISKLVEDISGAWRNDTIVLKALQDMASMDFACEAPNWAGDSGERFAKVGLYLSALYRLFAKVLPDKNYRKVDGVKIQRLDFAMGQLVFAAGQIGAGAIERIRIQDERIEGRDKTKARRERRKAATDILYLRLPDKKVRQCKKLGPVAKLISDKWELESQKEKERRQKFREKCKKKHGEKFNPKKVKYLNGLDYFGEKPPDKKTIKVYLKELDIVIPRPN